MQAAFSEPRCGSLCACPPCEVTQATEDKYDQQLFDAHCAVLTE